MDNDTIFYNGDFKLYEAPKIPLQLSGMISAVTEGLTSVIGSESHQTNSYEPSEEEIREQLLIEQRIQEQKQLEAEEYEIIFFHLNNTF